MANRILIDHIGWDLWRASQAWKSQLTQKMVARGHAVYGEARGGLIRHIGVEGISQVALATKAGVSKQAVQQHIDELVNEGYAVRRPDPTDARKKIVVLTQKGEALFHVANDVKQEIEEHYLELIGAEHMQVLRAALAKIVEDGS